MEDIEKVRQFIKDKSMALMSHEKKNYAQAGFPLRNYKVYKINSRVFYSVEANIFKSIIDDILLEAIQKFPQNFGNGNAVSVIEAINQTEQLYEEIEDVIRILKNENCCYVMENDKGNIPNKILRLDLFRKLDPTKSNVKNFDFTGGLFHTLKHFSFQGKPLSTGQEKNDLTHPRQIISHAINAFFLEPGEFIDESTYISHINVNENYKLKFVFYHEPNTRVFFITTSHRC